MSPRRIYFSPNSTPEFQKEIQSHLRVFILASYGRGLSYDEAVSFVQDQGLGLSVSRGTVAKWYGRFERGDFSLEDHPRSGRHLLLDDDELTEIFRDELTKNPQITWDELAKIGYCNFYRAKHSS